MESSASDSQGHGGEALVACLREVPALYFKEDFALEDGATFRAACPFSTAAENLVLQEKLTQYLDVVELHLVKEISLRSNSFFEAQRQLQDLNVEIVEGCSRIRELKETIRLLDVDLVDSARQVQHLNATRTNLLALHHKFNLILYVKQSLSALKLVLNLPFMLKIMNLKLILFELYAISDRFFFFFGVLHSLLHLEIVLEHWTSLMICRIWWSVDPLSFFLFLAKLLFPSLKFVCMKFVFHSYS